MSQVSVYNKEGKEVGTLELNDAVFGVAVNEHLVHLAVVAQLANKRQGTQKAKTRSEVSGGGRKPWRQKGTGHARQGSTRAPQWKGGGMVFAPVPRDYSFKINKKEKRAALKSALTSKVQDKKLIVLDEIKLDAIKTKDFKKILDNLKVSGALVVTDKVEKNVVLSARNLPAVQVSYITTQEVQGQDGETKREVKSAINVYDIMRHEFLVVTKDAVAKIEEVYA